MNSSKWITNDLLEKATMSVGHEWHGEASGYCYCT